MVSIQNTVGRNLLKSSEEIISKSPGTAQADKLRKRIDLKNADLDRVKASIRDEAGAIKKLEESVVRFNKQVTANTKSAADLDKQLKELRKIDPAVKVVVSSGYSSDPVMAKHKDYGFCSAIAKPFHLMELSRTINQIMVMKK